MEKRLDITNKVGYGCVVVATAAKNDKEKKEQMESSKSFHMLSQYSGSDKILGEIFIDVITSRKRNRPYLEAIKDTFCASGRSKPCGVITISTLSDLGKTPPEMANNYSELNAADIGIMVLDCAELNTADESGNYCMDENQRAAIVSSLFEGMPSKFRINRGRKQREIELTEAFKEIYWYYETYRLAEKNTYKNKLIQLNKISFKECCRKYEASKEYKDDEYQKSQEYYFLVDLPKRCGTVPENFKELMTLHNSGMDLESACVQLGVPPMTEITYRRFMVKQEMGKKGMAQAAFHFFDDELNERLRLPDDGK